MKLPSVVLHDYCPLVERECPLTLELYHSLEPHNPEIVQIWNEFLICEASTLLVMVC